MAPHVGIFPDLPERLTGRHVWFAPFQATDHVPLAQFVAQLADFVLHQIDSGFLAAKLDRELHRFVDDHGGPLVPLVIGFVTRSLHGTAICARHGSVSMPYAPM